MKKLKQVECNCLCILTTSTRHRTRKNSQKLATICLSFHEILSYYNMAMLMTPPRQQIQTTATTEPQPSHNTIGQVCERCRLPGHERNLCSIILTNVNDFHDYGDFILAMREESYAIARWLEEEGETNALIEQPDAYCRRLYGLDHTEVMQIPNFDHERYMRLHNDRIYNWRDVVHDLSPEMEQAIMEEAAETTEPETDAQMPEIIPNIISDEEENELLNYSTTINNLYYNLNPNTNTPVVEVTHQSQQPQREHAIPETNCAICMEELTETNHFVARCGHQYHASCVFRYCSFSDTSNRHRQQTQTQTQTCPTCRLQLV